MKKTKEQIQKKREEKYVQLEYKTKKQTEQKIIKFQEESSAQIEYKTVKIKKKSDSFLAKKKLEYERKMKNELRQLEGKPQREYKQKKWTRNKKLQFALEILQENCKLRDTNQNGEGVCISCNLWKKREELAGGHRWSRRIQGVCLNAQNVNAQCHTCNYTTWPRGDKQAMERVNLSYDRNAIRKYGKDVWTQLEKLKNASVIDPLKYAPTETEIDDAIGVLIWDNRHYWKQKNFYKPKKNRKKIYEKERLKKL